MSHNKTWACINPCGDGCDGDHTPENIESAESRIRELEAALSVAREALERIGGILPNPMMEDDEVSVYYERLARRALLRHTTQKEAERIRAMEEIVEKCRPVTKAYWNFDVSMKTEIRSLEEALWRLDEREG